MTRDPEQMHRRVEAARQGVVPGAEDEEPRGRLDVQQIETWVDQSIRQAQRRGDFDNLPGAGKPLRGLDRPHDPDWWVKSLVEREDLDLTAALPGPIALRRERATFPEALLEMSEEHQVRERLEDFNARVLEDRLRPSFAAGSPAVVGRVDVETMVAAWRALREERAAEPPEDAAGAPDAAPAAPGGRRRRRWWPVRGSRGS